MHLETWVVDELSKFLGIDDETLKTNVVPYLWTIETPDALSEHLMVSGFRHCVMGLYELKDKNKK